MASASETAVHGTHSFSPEDILSEVRNFLKGANYMGQVNHESLAQSALFLLRTLPTARHAVLEHLGNIFDEASNSHILQLEFGNTATKSGPSLDSVLKDACGVLHGFIKSHPSAWAPIISTWSLELLGHISSKYSDRRGVPHAGSLNELLQLWMMCEPTKLLIEVATECFAAMVGGAPDTCVDALLEASVKYSPHFDWVVAHIGSCFPNTIITRVLMCGLKDFCHHGNRLGETDTIREPDEKVPKMASVVGILGHLASKHGHDIRKALMKLFEESLRAESDAVRATTIPFLLQLASMSPMLLHIMTTDIVKALTAPVLNNLHHQFAQWRARCPQEYDSLMNLVVHLVMKSDMGAHQALDFLLHNAAFSSDGSEEKAAVSPLPEVQYTCRLLIEQLLNEIQKFVFRKRQGHSDQEVPFLVALKPHVKQLTKEMLLSSEPKCSWLQKLVCYVVLYSGENLGADVLTIILCEAKDKTQLSKFLSVQCSIEVGCPQILPMMLKTVMDGLQSHRDINKYQILCNIRDIVDWEKTTTNIAVRSSLVMCLQAHWEPLSNLLLNNNLEVGMVALKILSAVAMPMDLTSAAVLHVCGALTAIFFRLLQLLDNSTVLKMVVACKKCAQQLSKKVYAQCILVRYLVEGVIEKENKLLFGGKSGLESTSSAISDDYVSLLDANQKHSEALSLVRSHTSVYHAGIIGQGLRKSIDASKLTTMHINRNKQCLIEILWVCSREHKESSGNHDTSMEVDTEHHDAARYSLNLTADMCRMVGSLIVELVTPDVLYNTRFWPEEESLKLTVERDLMVWKNLDNNPVLWDIVEMYAGNSLVMSRCSPVLRSLTATLMNYFDASREKLARNSPKQLECACRLVRCLGKSCLLPQPLSHVAELFPFATSHEVYRLLLSIWKYMKETPPTEDPSEVSRRVCEPRHVEMVRAIFHSNIKHVGQIYSRFFAQQEEPSKTKTEPARVQ